MSHPSPGPDGSPPPGGDRGYTFPTGSVHAAGAGPYPPPQPTGYPEPAAGTGQPTAGGYPAPGGDAVPGGYPAPGGYPVPGQPGPAGAGTTMEYPNLAGGVGHPGATGYPNPAGVPAPTSGGAVPPTSAPGTPGWYPGAPMSAPAGQPMAAPPGSGVPYGAPAGTAPRGGQKVLVLAIVAGLLFVLGGIMTGLFIAKSGELTRTERDLKAQVAQRDTRIDANTKEIEGLKRDLQTANDKVKSVEQDLTGTQNDRDEQARQKKVIAECLDLFTKAMTADTRSEFDKAIKAAEKPCNEADKYL